VPDARAADAFYELVGPIALPQGRKRRFMGVFMAIGGHTPFVANPGVEFQIRDRHTGSVVYRATTRNSVSERSWVEQLTRDLKKLSKNEFDQEWGIDPRGKPAEPS
jgi:hypothetical protein